MLSLNELNGKVYHRYYSPELILILSGNQHGVDSIFEESGLLARPICRDRFIYLLQKKFG
jgi:hypothetical protein